MSDHAPRPPEGEPAETTELASAGPRGHPPDLPVVPGYRILRPIGAGGMGRVYEAGQERPVRRRVALKVIKRGMDTDEVVARFEGERQALALMSHPAIAAVYDAGATADGLPFFAMELVRGEPITDYCDRHRMDLRERLELFLQVCEGVQHAHQKGVIHRDLKPSNVLVSVAEGSPAPKIIDFGVAKATSRPLTDRSLHTTLGALIGTPEYMSPEQAEMTGLDIDTRSDVYSLGVMLYELLTGVLPFDLSGPRRAGLATIQRVIRDEEARAPSTRVTALGEREPALSGARRTGPATLARRLRGDLDWIVLKALEKDRTRRYETANALAADIRRHLADEPVEAGPPSTVYRARKFVRRHRAGVVAATLVAAAVVAGLVGTSLALARATAAEARATREAKAAQEVSDFLVDLFRGAEPGAGAGESVSARELLERGATRIELELDRQPAIRARMMESIGTVYRHLGLYHEAGPLLERSLSARVELMGDDSLEAAASLQQLAELFFLQGRYREARQHAERALAIREERLGPDDPLVADSLSVRGRALGQSTRRREAEALLRRALTIREAAFDDDSPEVAEAAHDLGIELWGQGRLDDAGPLLARALAAWEASLGPGDYRTRKALNDLAVVEWSRGDLERAEDLFRRSLAIKERFAGPDHPEVASTLNNLALIHDAQGRPAEAQELLERALGIYRQRLGTDHDKTAMVTGNLAWALYRQGRHRQAEPLYEEALAIYERTVGSSHPSTAILLRDQARLYEAQGRTAQAERRLRRSLAAWEESVGGSHPETAATLQALADLYAAGGRDAEAEPLYRRALEIRRAALGEEHPAVVESRRALAELLRATERRGEAERLAGEGGG